MEAVGAGMNRTVVIYFVVAFAIAFLSFRAIWFSFIMPIYEPVFGLGEEVGSIFNSGDFAAIGTWGALLFALGVALPLACLLYTSPSPRDRTRSRMPSSA